MGLLRKFQQFLPRASLLTIYKTFIRSRLDYADINYDQAYNSAFHDKLKNYTKNQVQNLVNSGVGLENFVIFIQIFYSFIFNGKSPLYLFNLIPNFNRVHNTRLSYNIPPIKVRHYFKNSTFASAITDCDKLDLNIRNSASLNTFTKKLPNFMRPCANDCAQALVTFMNINLGIAFEIF